MRWMIALVAPIMCAGAAAACPPPPQNYVPPTREQMLREQVASADAIIYGVVGSTIGHGEIDPFTGRFSGHAGTVRIRHVYKGDLRVGQRIRMYGLSYETDCGSLHYRLRTGRAGAYGLLLLHYGPGRREPYAFIEFVDESTVAELIRLGLIRSAQRVAR
jgi:hypothetical protein